MKSAQAFPALLLAMGLLTACASAPPAPARSTPLQGSASFPSTRAATPTPTLTARAASPSLTVAAASASAPVQPSEAPGSSRPSAVYTTPLLDGPTLTRAIRATCRTAVSERRPILLEFSAPWCADCLVLEQLKQAQALASELSRWQLLPINVGSGDEHPELMRAFHVDAIAKLVVLAPQHCSAPISIWRRGLARTLDGLRAQGDGAGAELAAWLASARAQLRYP